MATFSDASTRVNTPGLSVVFAYRMAPFSGGLRSLITCKSEIFEPADDFGISSLQSSHLVSSNCDESKALFLWILGILRHLFYEISFLPAYNVVYLVWFSMSTMLYVRGSMLPDWR